MRIIFLFIYMVLSPELFSQATKDTAMTMEKAFEKQWIKYFERNINLNVPIHNGCKPGTFKVVIQFRIDKDGKITDIYPLTNNGYGMEEEVARVVRKGPNWIQTMKDGQMFAYKTQPVIFMLGDREPDYSKQIDVSNAAGLLKEIFVHSSH